MLNWQPPNTIHPRVARKATSRGGWWKPLVHGLSLLFLAGGAGCGGGSEDTGDVSVGPPDTVDEENSGIRCRGLGGTLSATMNHACGLLEDRSIACWGNSGDGQVMAPTGQFQQVSAGIAHSCAVGMDGSISCWGFNGDGQSTPPPGAFTQVSAGSSHTCAITTEAALVCWGSVTEVPFGGPFRQVTTGQYPTCVLMADGAVGCWGGNDYPVPSPAGAFLQVSAGYLLEACAVRDDGSIVCWGNGKSTEIVRPPEGSFVEVSKGLVHTCAVTSEGMVSCWGTNDHGETTPPAGRFVHVAAANGFTCGMKNDGRVVCWGREDIDTPPAVPFLQLGPDGRPCME